MIREPLVLIEIGAVDAATGAPSPLRYCTGEAWRTKPTETPPNALYKPRIVHPGDWRIESFDKAGSYTSRTASGEIVLNDADGQLGKALIALALAGLTFTARLGWRDSVYPSGFVPLIKGMIAAEPTYEWDEIRIKLADRQAELHKPLAAVRYAGTGGLEGGDDIKGQPKPLVPGIANNMTPRQVIPAKLIFQVSAPIGDAAVSASAVRDGGVPLAAGGTYASLADLQNDAFAPSAGQYKVYSNIADGCWVRTGSKPVRGITVDAAYGVAADRTAAQIARRILLAMGIASGDISAADIAALDTAQPAELDLYVGDERTARDILDEVMGSVGAWWSPDALGVFRCQRLEAPAGTPVATLRAARLMGHEGIETTATGEGVPAWRVRIEYGRNWTVQQDGDLAGDKSSPTDTVRAPGGLAGLDARAWLAQETRSVEASDAAVKTIWPTPADPTFRTLISSQSAAQAEGNRQLDLLKVRRDRSRITQRMTPELMTVVGMGAVVKLQLDRWDYTTGRLMSVIGIKPDALTKEVGLVLWG